MFTNIFGLLFLLNKKIPVSTIGQIGLDQWPPSCGSQPFVGLPKMFRGFSVVSNCGHKFERQKVELRNKDLKLRNGKIIHKKQTCVTK